MRYSDKRYVKCRIPGFPIEVEYDKENETFEYHIPLWQWEPCENIEHYNDDERE